MTPAAAPSAVVRSPWFARLPIGLFSVPFGTFGLGLLWRRAALTLGLPAAVGEVILASAGALFVVLLAGYLVKLARHRASVAGEWDNPTSANFFAVIAINLLLASIALQPHAPDAGRTLFVAGAVGQIAICLVVFARWILHVYEPAALNPTWFIPAVGNIVVPLPAILYGQPDVGWFYAGTGFGLWTCLIGPTMGRLIFGPPLPAPLLPTLTILVAPPSVGYLAYVGLATAGEAATAAPDFRAMLIFYFALFTAMTLLVLAPRLLAAPFGVPWWAFTFPSTAFGLASLDFAVRKPGPVTVAIAWAALMVATVAVVGVAARTAAALAAGRLLPR